MNLISFIMEELRQGRSEDREAGIPETNGATAVRILDGLQAFFQNVPQEPGDAKRAQAMATIANAYAVLHLADTLENLFDNYLYNVGND